MLLLRSKNRFFLFFFFLNNRREKIKEKSNFYAKLVFDDFVVFWCKKQITKHSDLIQNP